jgi:TRAP-type C4-dicarboxylate transport system permease small subunit
LPSDASAEDSDSELGPRRLQWRSLDPVETIVTWTCGLLLLGFVGTEMLDVVLRNLGHLWPDAQEWTLGFFIWGSFLGGAVAVRRGEHFRLAAVGSAMKGPKRLVLETFIRFVLLTVAGSMVYFGYINFLEGFHSFMQPSLVPYAVLFAAIPVGGGLIFLFSVEQLVNGWRTGFEGVESHDRALVAALSPETAPRDDV